MSSRTIDQAGELRSSAIESLRALAALGVLESHLWGVAHRWGPAASATFFDRIVYGGGFGVYLFFALTGYLLYRPFARRDLAGGRAVRVSTYLRNRALRVLPLYYVTLVVFMIVVAHGGSPGQWWRFAFFLQNFFTSTVSTVDGPMWSLVVEVQFYVLLPVAALLIARLARGSAARAMGVLAGAGVLAELIRLATVTLRHDDSLRWHCSLPSTCVFFVGGMFVAVLEVTWAGRRPDWLRGVFASATAWLAASVVLWLVVFYDNSLDVLVVPASALLIGAVVLPLERTSVVDLLEWRPLASIGVVSYSIYLWHLPIILKIAARSWAPSNFLLLLLLFVPMILVISFLSYRLVEAPFLRLRGNWGERTVASPTALGTAAASVELPGDVELA